MKKIIVISLFVASFYVAEAQSIIDKISLGRVHLTVSLVHGTPYYQVSFDNKEVIRPSKLGLALASDSNFSKGLEVVKKERRIVNENWKPLWGEVRTVNNHYEELTVKFRQKEESNTLLNIIFRVFADGVAFRYEFPEQQTLNHFIVSCELSSFQLTADHKAFWIPGDYDTNEYKYTTSRLSEVDAWRVEQAATDIAVRVVPDQFAVQTPLMLKTDDGLYINIHEAALRNYPALQLHVDRETKQLNAQLVPDALNNKAYLQAPFQTPWRTILMSDDAKDILASKMILNLNDPPADNVALDWIKPMKFVGVWWGMQTGTYTWSYADNAQARNEHGQLIPNGRHGANTANVKRYIDFAAANHIGGVLVEGWNYGWEDWFGSWKEEVFDFTKPYPDFDMQEITRYAKSKGVMIIMHHETSGAVTSFERQLDTAYRLMDKLGYHAVKTGYVGKIIPRGEHHDGQWMVNHYERIAQKALEHQVMVDAHEAVRPTGLHRTYPNWLACESARGNEYNAFSDGNPPEHETILPFTRLIGGPMDYTPGIFKLRNYALGAPDRQVHTTLAKQLALYVTLYSPLQMAADRIEHYEPHMDAFAFIRDVPVDWDDTKILEAEPGDYITIARKAKGSDDWFLGAITDEQARTTSIPLDFLDEGQSYTAIVYGDAANADWQTNPEAYEIKQVQVNKHSILALTLAKGGGAAVCIKKL